MHDHGVPADNKRRRIGQPIRNRPRLPKRIPKHDSRRLAVVELINPRRNDFN
jgi:hypothetical protein